MLAQNLLHVNPYDVVTQTQVEISLAFAFHYSLTGLYYLLPKQASDLGVLGVMGMEGYNQGNGEVDCNVPSREGVRYV